MDAEICVVKPGEVGVLKVRSNLLLVLVLFGMVDDNMCLSVCVCGGGGGKAAAIKTETH